MMSRWNETRCLRNWLGNRAWINRQENCWSSYLLASLRIVWDSWQINFQAGNSVHQQKKWRDKQSQSCIGNNISGERVFGQLNYQMKRAPNAKITMDQWFRPHHQGNSPKQSQAESKVCPTEWQEKTKWHTATTNTAAERKKTRNLKETERIKGIPRSINWWIIKTRRVVEIWRTN